MGKNSSSGFTLIELLVALCIFSIMAAAVYSALSAGLESYSRVKAFSGTQTDALISLEKLERDLNNTFMITGIDFNGDANRISFPLGSPIIRVSYYFDEDKSVLIRDEQSYGKAVSNPGAAQVNPAELAQLKGLNFSFCSYDKETKILKWKDLWPSGSGLPRGVKIEAEFDSGGKTVKVERIVFIPVSG